MTYVECSKCKKHTMSRTKIKGSPADNIIRYHEKCIWCGKERTVEGNWSIGYKEVKK